MDESHSKNQLVIKSEPPDDIPDDEMKDVLIKPKKETMTLRKRIKKESSRDIFCDKSDLGEKSTDLFLSKLDEEISANNAQIGEKCSEENDFCRPLKLRPRPPSRVFSIESVFNGKIEVDTDTEEDIQYDVDDLQFIDDGLIRCSACRTIFDDEEDLEEHCQNRTPGISFGCCACNKIFKDNSQLNIHIRKHTGEKPYQCRICGKRFSIKGNLSKHMRTHTGERRFECDTCNKKFTQFAHLEDHIKVHSVDRPFACDQCHMAFKTKARLRKHIKSHDEMAIRKRCVRCPVCSKVMKTSKQLYSHMRIHTGEDGLGSFYCEVCGKYYKSQFYLQCHQKAHEGVRPYKCELCEKSFVTSSQMRRHENSHAGFKPYTCQECLKAFATFQNLKRHMLTHTGVKPYVCSTCNKGFLTLENMNRHTRIHTGEKPYSCDICGRQFAHSTTAKEHRRIHTGDKPFGCSICEKKFTVNKMLYKHMRSKHPEFYDTFKEINNLPINARRAFAHNFSKDEYQQPEYIDLDEATKEDKPPLSQVPETEKDLKEKRQISTGSKKRRKNFETSQTDGIKELKSETHSFEFQPRIVRKRKPNRKYFSDIYIDVLDNLETIQECNLERKSSEIEIKYNDVLKLSGNLSQSGGDLIEQKPIIKKELVENGW